LVTVNAHDAGQLFIQGDSNFAAAGLADTGRPRAVESMRKRHAVAKREHRRDGALNPRRSIPSSRTPAASYASGLLPWVNGAFDEFTLAATAQNLRRLAKLAGHGPPPNRGVLAPA